jgi:hypothetical protein
MPSDADAVREIAGRYTGHPEVVGWLYQAADYLTVLERGDRAPTADPEPAPEPAGALCPMRWAVPVRSVAVGPDVKEETCGRPASIPMEYEGALYVVCPACRDELAGMGGQECEAG